MHMLTVDQTHAVKAPPLKLVVRLDDGARFELDAVPGLTVMNVIEAYGLPIRTEPALVGPGAPGHVRVSLGWRMLLPPASDKERGRLSVIPAADASSRLADEIVMSQDLDGLEIELPPDSLIPQTNWVAG